MECLRYNYCIIPISRIFKYLKLIYTLKCFKTHFQQQYFQNIKI